MSFQREAAAAIEALGLGDRFGIVHDTFQHALAGDPDILGPHIRIVHILGVSGGAGVFTDAQDAERHLLDARDRTGAVDQMRRLLASGYTGAFFNECTDPSVRERDNLKAPIAGSIDYLRRAIGAAWKTSTHRRPR